MPDLAAAAFAAGGDAVVMAGRLFGMIPDIETMAPLLGTTLGVGGHWNLPLTCHWLSLTRAKLGQDQPLIGANGFQDGLDVVRGLLAGATAIEMTSAVMLRGFELLRQSLAELRAYRERNRSPQLAWSAGPPTHGGASRRCRRSWITGTATSHADRRCRARSLYHDGHFQLVLSSSKSIEELQRRHLTRSKP